MNETLDRRRVQEMADTFSADFKKGDFYHMSSFFAENAIYMPSGRETVKGRGDIEKHWRVAHESGVEGFQVHVETVETLGNIAYEIGNATAQIRRAPHAHGTIDTVRYLVIWKKDPDGVWRILVDISNKNAP